MDIREKILEDRQLRVENIYSLIEKNRRFIISVKVNVCGNDKNLKSVVFIRKYFINKILSLFSIANYKNYSSYDGDYALIEINETNYKKVKAELVLLEEGVFGRYIDLDLYVSNKPSISRKDIGYPKRKCIICNDDVVVCARTKKHSVEEVLIKNDQLIKKELVEYVVKLASESMFEEVSAHPKFGLVTYKSNGRHQDMNYKLFLKSIKVIKPYLLEYANEGFEINETSFDRLRAIGKRCEVEMFNQIGVNTHKGTIFLLGFLLPSIVNALYNNDGLDAIQSTVEFLSNNILNDFNSIGNEKTYGEKAYLNYGITGIRGEVYNGLPIVFAGVKKFSSSSMACDELVICCLVHSMQYLDDTVILHRNELVCLQRVKEVATIINNVGCNTQKGKSLIINYTEQFIAENISPGGSADLVICMLILIKTVRLFFSKDEVDNLF